MESVNLPALRAVIERLRVRYEDSRTRYNDFFIGMDALQEAITVNKQHHAAPRLSELSQLARAEQESWALREAIKVLEAREAAALQAEAA